MAMLFYRGGMQPVEDVHITVFSELLETADRIAKNIPLQLVVDGWPPTQTLPAAYIGRVQAQRLHNRWPFRTTVY